MSDNEIIKINNQVVNTINDIPIDKSFSYDGYQVVRGEFFAHLFEPSVTFNKEKVAVNVACINKLHDTEYVQFLVNPIEKKLAIKPCAEESKDSFCWISKSKDGKRKPKSISCKIFYAKVMNLMGWNPDYRYKILGKLIRTHSDTLFIFDLSCAETYIKKTMEGNIESRKAFFPEEWKNQFGVPVKNHQDMTLVSIFDDYTVFKIDKDEEREGVSNETNNDIRHEEKQNQDPQENLKNAE
jgi:hypothetical protein